MCAFIFLWIYEYTYVLHIRNISTNHVGQSYVVTRKEIGLWNWKRKQSEQLNTGILF